jgi:hypothetical protein
MNILIIGNTYVLKGLRGNLYYMIEYFKDNSEDVMFIYDDQFDVGVLDSFKPDIIYFVHVGSMNNKELMDSCRHLEIPLCVMSIDLFRVRDIIKSSTFHQLDAIIGPVKCTNIYDEYKKSNPNLIVKNFSTRFINTDSFCSKDVDKLYDIIYYGSNEVNLPVLLSDDDDNYFRRMGIHDECIANKDKLYNFYPFRKRLFDLLKDQPRYNMKIIEPCGAAEASTKGEDLATLISQSYLGVATCARVDYLFCKHMEIPASGCVILGTHPKEYDHVFSGNTIQLRDDMEDGEILDVIDEALSDKIRLANMGQKFGEEIRAISNYSVAMKEFNVMTEEIIKEYLKRYKL